MISSDFNNSLMKRYGGSSSGSMSLKALMGSNIHEALGSHIQHAYTADCALVFSDVSGFSSTTQGYDADRMKKFLDSYYERAIPIIYQHGGVIDQMLGDGIISVFFSDRAEQMGSSVWEASRKCARALVKEFAGDAALSTKCALHKDRFVVCNVGDSNYTQATLVGEGLTKLTAVQNVFLSALFRVIAVDFGRVWRGTETQAPRCCPRS